MKQLRVQKSFPRRDFSNSEDSCLPKSLEKSFQSHLKVISRQCRQISSDFDIPRTSSPWRLVAFVQSASMHGHVGTRIETHLKNNFSRFANLSSSSSSSRTAQSRLNQKSETLPWGDQKATIQISHSQEYKNKLKYFPLKCDWHNTSMHFNHVRNSMNKYEYNKTGFECLWKTFLLLFVMKAILGV